MRAGNLPETKNNQRKYSKYNFKMQRELEESRKYNQRDTKKKEKIIK